jgi:hypothetical protein
MLVEVAGAGGGVEDGAGFGVAQGFSGFSEDFVGEEWGVLVVVGEDAGVWVAGEVWG